VTVDGRSTGTIAHGLVVLLGVERGDGPSDRDYIVSKVRDVRIFADDAGKMNLSTGDAGGAVLVVSQFTLLADARKGRRPSWSSRVRSCT